MTKRPWFYSANLIKDSVIYAFSSGVITTEKTGVELYKECVDSIKRCENEAKRYVPSESEIHMLALNRLD